MSLQFQLGSSYNICLLLKENCGRVQNPNREQPTACCSCNMWTTQNLVTFQNFIKLLCDPVL